MFPLLLLLFDMYTRTIILQRGIFSCETKQPCSLLVFRDERGIVHRVETTDDIWNLEDFPEGPIDHLAYQPSWLPCWTKWQGDPSTVFIKEADYFNTPVSRFWTILIVRIKPNRPVRPQYERSASWSS